MRAEIEGRAVDRQIVFPRSALREGGTVWIATPEGRLRIVPVDVIVNRDETVIATSTDLPDDAAIIVAAPAFVADGMAVRAIPDAERFGAEDAP